METVATLPRISRESLSALLLAEAQGQGQGQATTSTTITSTTSPPVSKLAIIDVRDDGQSSFPFFTSSKSHPSPFPLLLSSPTQESNADHIGGHIRSSTWVPSSTLNYEMPELVRTLQQKEVVVFHCALSQQRGPAAALRYLRERRRLMDDVDDQLAKEKEGGMEEGGEKRQMQRQRQKVYVLDGGFVKWQEKHGPDTVLTEKWARDLWEEGGP
jgi:rhodanese-related sulfurtransferase